MTFASLQELNNTYRPAGPCGPCGAVVVAQVVVYQTTDIEVPSSIPTGSWAFSTLLFPISGVSLWRCNTTDFHLQLEAKQA